MDMQSLLAADHVFGRGTTRPGRHGSVAGDPPVSTENCSGTLGLVAPGGGGLHPPCRSSVEVRRPAGGRSQARNSDPASPPARRPVATRRPPAQAPRPVYAVVDVMVMPARPAAPMTRALAARAE